MKLVMEIPTKQQLSNNFTLYLHAVEKDASNRACYLITFL